jgi:hypothetical protein
MPCGHIEAHQIYAVWALANAFVNAAPIDDRANNAKGGRP